MNFMKTGERSTRTFAPEGEEAIEKEEGTVATEVNSVEEVVEEVTPETAEEPIPKVVENPAPKVVAEPAPKISRNANPSVGAPSFLRLSDVDGTEFAGQWLPSMTDVGYIGKTAMLLAYIQQEEKHHHLTMPIKACGIDPILFENVSNAMPDAPTTIFAIKPEDASDDSAEMYELVNVDGEYYLSCVSSCIDKDYLNGMIAEATVSIRETGQYIFQMVGFRKLALEEGQQVARLINTLRMNTYEMSALISYMEQFENMQVSYETIKDHQCICFRV